MSNRPNEIIKLRIGDGSLTLHRYSDNPCEIILTSLLVYKNRRSGTGTKLMLRAEQIAKGLGATHICLQTNKFEWVSKWYERIGYKFLMDSENNLVWMKKII